MPDTQLLLIVIVLLALGFDFLNGFHDSANAIATSVSTRVLSPRQAIMMAAVLNMVGALMGTAVAKTVGAGIIDPTAVTEHTIIAALISAIIWDILTWYLALPTSSSHALIASVIGAGIATSGGIGILKWGGIEKVLIGLVFSPVIGFVVGLGLMVGLMWLLRRTPPSVVTRRFKKWQVLSAAFMAFSHGSNDAQKTMGIITMALVSAGNLQTFQVPTWVHSQPRNATMSGLLGSPATALHWRIVSLVSRQCCGEIASA